MSHLGKLELEPNPLLLSNRSLCFPLSQVGWARALAQVPGGYIPVLGGRVMPPIQSFNSVCISKSPNTRSSRVVHLKIGGVRPMTFCC